jgi:hypothetical protein
MRLVVVKLIALLLLCVSCNSGPPTLVGVWKDEQGGYTQFTADGHVKSGPYTFDYLITGPTTMSWTIRGVPGADGVECKLSYVLGPKTLIMNFTEFNGSQTVPPELAKMGQMTHTRVR